MRLKDIHELPTSTFSVPYRQYKRLPVILRMPLVDELAMIHTTSLISFATFSYSLSRRFSIDLAVFFVSFTGLL